jgi:menaquinone-dependent protoporphyrinogen oxidase
MPEKILIAYASRHGATKEIAEALAGAIREAGFEADVRPAGTVADVSLYAGVVIGAPLYAGTLLKDLPKFAERHAKVLKAKPVAAFVSGSSLGEPGPDDIKNAEKALEGVRSRLPLLDVAYFGGRFDPGSIPVVGFFVRLGGKDRVKDNRDWDKIREWGRTVPATLGIAPAA